MTFPGGALWPWIPPARVGRGTAFHPRSPGSAHGPVRAMLSPRGSVPVTTVAFRSQTHRPCPACLVHAQRIWRPALVHRCQLLSGRNRRLRVDLGRWGLGSRLGLGRGRPTGSGCGLLGLRRDSWFVCSFIHRVRRSFHETGSEPLDFRAAVLVTGPRSRSRDDTKPGFSHLWHRSNYSSSSLGFWEE